MKAKHSKGTDPLRAWLLAGDPVRNDEAPLDRETAGARARIVATARGRSPRPALRWGLAALAAAFAAATLLLLPASPSGESTPTTPNSVESTPRIARQVHFVTPGGTRVYWTIEGAGELPRRDR